MSSVKGCFVLILGIFALGLTIALSLVIYRAGTMAIEGLERGWEPWISAVFVSIPIVFLGIGIWYVLGSFRLRLRRKAAEADRARAQVNDFTPTQRGFAPRLLGGKIVNPNVVPSVITPLDVVECPEEIPEERRLAGVMGWHLSNAPAPAGRIPQRAALPIPEPQPSPWQISHVEQLLLEAGETTNNKERINEWREEDS